MTDDAALFAAWHSRQYPSPDQLTWLNAPYRPAPIMKALRLDPSDPHAHYAAWPFRVIMDDGRHWIAGAIGCPPTLSYEAAANWYPADIDDIILWNPRSNVVRVMGEVLAQSILINPENSGTIYADGFSFFRAWAETRAAFAMRFRARHRWHVTATEPWHGGVPGALLIGDIRRVTLPDCDVITAGPGVDPAALRQAVRKQFRVPRVDAPEMRAAA